MLRSFKTNGQDGLHRMVSWLFLCFPAFNLTLLVLGVGNLEPNEQGDNEGEEPETGKDETWKTFLEGNGSLKSWSAVTLLKGTKVDIASAMREYLRQAWSKVFFLLLFST